MIPDVQEGISLRFTLSTANSLSIVGLAKTFVVEIPNLTEVSLDLSTVNTSFGETVSLVHFSPLELSF